MVGSAFFDYGEYGPALIGSTSTIDRSMLYVCGTIRILVFRANFIVKV